MARNRASRGEADREHASGTIDTRHLFLEWSEASWDTAVFGFPVLQITDMELRSPTTGNVLHAFESVRDALGAGLVSCRLPHDRLRESITLEEHGFRFIEMLYQPEFNNLEEQDEGIDTGLTAARAVESDLPALLGIAGSAFTHERFHVDPRLDPASGDQRYCNWVRSALDHPAQRLHVLRDGSHIVSFFVTEMLPGKTCYWHLNAVAPSAQGRGYGRRAWTTMLRLAGRQGATRVRTCIVARNHRALNLYARLNFHFPPPLMTFHWVRTAAS